MAGTQNQIPHNKLTQFKQSPDLRTLRSSSSKIVKTRSSIQKPSKHDVLALSTSNSLDVYTTPDCSNDFPVYTKSTKTKKLVTTTSDITFDCTEVTMSELIRISSNKRRIFSSPNIFNDGIFFKNCIDITKDLSLVPKKLDSSQKKQSAIESSLFFPKVKLNNGALVLDEDSIIMKPRREKMDNSSQILYESIHEMDNSKLKQKKRYTVHHWSESETQLFFKAINQFGTDFGMIQNSLFPLRSRLEIKNKFKREERQHPIRMERALRKNMPLMQFLTHKDLKNAESGSLEGKKVTEE